MRLSLTETVEFSQSQVSHDNLMSIKFSLRKEQVSDMKSDRANAAALVPIGGRPSLLVSPTRAKLSPVLAVPGPRFHLDRWKHEIRERNIRVCDPRIKAEKHWFRDMSAR